jgi:hypothetical protein
MSKKTALLFLGSDSFYRTVAGTSAAVDAECFVDNELAVAFFDSFYRAFCLAGAASNALVANNMSHDKDPP